MLSIESLTPTSSPAWLAAARALFRSYAEFLRSTGSHCSFRYDVFEQETLTLPVAYTERGGEFLLAVDDGVAAGCIAYRAAEAGGEADLCEFKRLFVSPEQRGRGVGRFLVEAALRRAAGRGFRTVCLDTDPATMAAAYNTYRRFGFTEYTPDVEGGSSCVVYLRRPLS